MSGQLHTVPECIYVLLLGLYCMSHSRQATVTEMTSSHTVTLEARHILTSRTENARGDPRASKNTGWSMYGENTHLHLAAAAIAEIPPAHPSWSLLSNLSCPLYWVVLPLRFSEFTAQVGTFCSLLVKMSQNIKYQFELFKCGLKELSYKALTQAVSQQI